MGRFVGFLARKLIHWMGTLILVVLVTYGINSYGLKQTLFMLGIVLLFESLFEFFRIEFRFFRFARDLTKDHEVNHFSSVTFAIAISIILYALFDMRLASCAISVAFFGDGAASLIGRTIGRHKIRFRKNKTWEGFIANFLTGCIVSVFFVPWYFGLIMAFISAFFELTCSSVEDNFFIPLITAFAGYALTLI